MIEKRPTVPSIDIDNGIVNVIHIDDSSDYLDELKDQINESELDWNLQRFKNPEKALAKIELHDGEVDCVFLDIDFPNSMSGFEFLRRFRRINNTAIVYIISNFNNDYDVFETYSTSQEEIRKLGAVDWIQKNRDPDLIDIHDLILKMKRYISMIIQFYEDKVSSHLDEVDYKINNINHNSAGLLSFIDTFGNSMPFTKEARFHCINILKSNSEIKSRSMRIRGTFRENPYVGIEHSADIYPSVDTLDVDYDCSPTRLDNILELKIENSPTEFSRYKSCLKKHLISQLGKFGKNLLYYEIDNSLKRNLRSKPSTKYEILAFVVFEIFNEESDCDWCARLLARIALLLKSAKNERAAITVSKLALEKAQQSRDLNLAVEISELI